jgi:hypothetical protein
MRTRTAPVLVVSGGNHVAVLVDAAETGNEFDLIEVLAGPGGRPPGPSARVRRVVPRSRRRAPALRGARQGNRADHSSARRRDRRRFLA